jgi:hypothetical protein
MEPLQTNDVQQAELIKNMASQVADLSTTVQTISKRLLLMTIFTIVTFLGFLVVAIKMWIMD